MFRQKFLGMVLLATMLLSQAVPGARAATYCDQAQFVSDLTAPDGTAFAPGATFTKTWRLMNIGTCTWTTTYNLIWVGGDSLSAPASVKLPVDVPPGQMVDLSVNLTAPTTTGHYKGLFKISNASGVQFGIGDSAGDPFWVDINVVQIDAVIYDFVANAPYAQWKSGAGALPFPGTSGDSRGFAYQVNNPHLEDDSIDPSPGLLTVPQNKYNGYIQATYPEIQIQQGDRLQTLVNCEFGATSCYVTFRFDYLLPNGAQKTLWSFKEAYDKRFYRADIDLSSLRGQRVRFVFMLLSTGFASGDRAIWGSPRIVRSGTTQPPAPPPTLTPLPPLTPTATPLNQPPPTLAPSGCDKASFVADVTIPDGTIFSPGAAFTKTWRLKNIGSCIWTTSYKLVYYSGEQMGAPTTVNLPWGAGYGQTVDISINMTAPNTAGAYRGFWILSNASGQFFGIGSNASSPVWVEINVTGDSPINAGYDFTANACSAQWKSGAGALPCPGTDGDSKGFVLTQDAPKMEDGSTGAPGLITFPQNKYNGYIQGYYPTFTVQPGDRFQATLGCAYGSNCSLTYRLDYMNPNGYIGTFWTWREQNEGKIYNADINLNPLAGRSVRFILTILATGYATNDRAIWGSPRILRTGGVAATVTPIPSTSNWPVYTNATYAFQFKYPPLSERFFETGSSILINMPITPGTNLREKYLQMTVRENINPCLSPLAQNGLPRPPENVVINGISFLKQAAADAGVGHLHDWIAYSTVRNNACISMDFVLHSLAAGNFATPVPEFDKAAESAVFAQVMSTFTWLTQAPPPTFTPVPATETVVPPTPTSTSTPGPTVNPSSIRGLSMIDSISGWATGQSSVLLTRDGGATWSNAMPNIGGNVTGSFFPNINTGWVITSSSQTGPGPGSLYFTSNGGLNWVRHDVPFNGGSMKFLDNNTGYVLQITGAATSKQSVILYKSTDGGATWATQYYNDPTIPGYSSSLPLAGQKNGITFINGFTGWVGGESPLSGSIYLYKTTDSGLNWTKQDLPIPAGYENAYVTTVEPKFFDSNNGILPVWMTLGSGMRDLFIYTTHDGGATWTRSSSFARQGWNADFVSIKDGFTWNAGGYLQVTHNAGGSWSQVASNANFGDNIPSLDFVSTTTGWAILNDYNTGTTTLYRTTDGGATWTLLFGAAAPPAPTPTQDPSAFAQTLVNALNAWDFNAVSSSMDQSILFAFWGSQGTSYTPALAIQQLQTNYLGTTPLTLSTGKDLNALLGGVSPYSIVGLDPAGSQALFVSGWGLTGNDEAIFYITRRTDGSLYWHSVLIALGGFAPAGTSISHDAFCADTRIPAIIEQLKGSMNQSNGDLFAGITSPTHGVDVRLWAYQPAINFSLTNARNVFADATIYNWGGGPSGQPDYGTFKDVIQPKMLEVLNAPNMETYCDNLTKVYPLANPWPYPNIRYYNLYKPGTPGTELDFRTWLIGIEYINNQPYLYAMVTVVWEP